MNRDAAIEAGARVLVPEAWATPSLAFLEVHRTVRRLVADEAREAVRASARRRAAAVIDAATPHLTGEPIGWAVVGEVGQPVLVMSSIRSAQRVRDLLPDGIASSLHVVALVPVEDQPCEVGNDGLADAEREECARRYREGPGRTDLGSRLP